MYSFQLAATLLAGVAYASPTGYCKSKPSCVSLTAEEVRSGGNNTLFTRWRPQSHYIAPAGWMNDPCGAMYDPTRDEYHLSYQWHPNHFNWGNISWGSATSKDLINWTDRGGWKDDEALILSPSGNGSYDGLGIFSGTAQPVNIHGEQDGTLLIFYTSVSRLPTNWALPYLQNTETQSLAISKDGGVTWENYENNPVITTSANEAPMDWNITGFRDPFLEPSSYLDSILEMTEPHYYAIFGSGIRGVAPRMPLWSAPANDLTNWTFQGAIFEPVANASFGTVLATGSYGFNFEVSGWFPLYDSKGEPHWYINMGSEGGNVSFHRSPQWSLWHEGDVVRRENGSAEFIPDAAGVADWGSGYALTSFNDIKHNRRVQYAWIKEDIVGDAGIFSARQQGYSGALSLPRQLFVHEVYNVTKTDEMLEAKTAVLEQQADGSYMARTMGNRPLPDVVEGLRNGTEKSSWPAKTFNCTEILAKQGSAHMELKATLTSATGAAGLVINASPDGEEFTNIMYEPSNHTILVDRLHSSNIVEFNNETITGYFYPYTVNGTQEAIEFEVFIDGSIAEIYVNSRFALSARIYPSKECSTGFGVYVAEGAEATFSGVEAWVGTANVWPQRPLNSSSELVWDSPEQTNNYTWWSGN